MPLHINTPLLHSRALSSALDGSAQVWAKMDALQPCGSFKLRGIGHMTEQLAQQGAGRFISSSGGNAGIAVAYCGNKLALPVTVVVPGTASARAISIMRGEGAEVIQVGESWAEANEHALQLVTPSDAFIHPFDHELLWRGHSTIIDEIVEAGIVPDAVVCSVGGGGLYIGIVQGLQRHGLVHVPVVAVETIGCDSMCSSVQQQQHVTLPAITSIATTLGAKKIADKAWQLCRSHPTRCVRVTDAAAVRACHRFLDDHRVLVEPACGAALAAIYDAASELQGFKCVVVIACGGSTCTAAMLGEWSAKLGV